MANNYVDFYKVFGVDQKAKKLDIKRTYHKLMLKYHPDKNPNQTIEEKEFCYLLNKAYEVLSDSTKRTQYDEIYKSHQKEAPSSNQSNRQHPYQGYSHFQAKLSNQQINLIRGLGIIFIMNYLYGFEYLIYVSLKSIGILLYWVACVILHIILPLMYTLGRIIIVLLPPLIKSLLFGIESLVNVLYFVLDNTFG